VNDPAIGGVVHFKDMMDHHGLTDAELVEQMHNASLSPALFNHEAHLRLGWLMVRMHGAGPAEELLCQLIQNYARAIGEAEMFDRALTISATRVITLCMARSRSSDFTTFMAEFPALKNDFRSLLLACNERGYTGLDQIMT